ncbi:crossover junction endodeoxyribonuclease RuvC [Candidatus Microgenomates bacterium]|nr:crossover junction endodeoxyribonuclease RuvC [Candidatus Microgenomates bacterium]
MLVLGIDPGIAITGIALVLEEKGKVILKHSDTILTSSSSSSSLRLLKLHKSLTSLIRKYHPDVCALESLFWGTNTKTALIVGQARGVVQLALCQNEIPIFEYTPLQVKMALTGYGRADKNQIQQMVKTIFKLPQILTPDDVSDAAAIALTHCFSYKVNNLK